MATESLSKMKYLLLGDKVPNFKAETTMGVVDFHEWMGDSWCILFSHPKDFTPVCTTELGRVAQLKEEWIKRNTKVIGLSCDSKQHHLEWINDINRLVNCNIDYPLIADESRQVAQLYGMLDQTWIENDMPLTCRSVFIIDPLKTLRLTLTYPASTGRNFTEILRVLDSLQLTSSKPVATPADWTKGKDCMVLPTLSREQAEQEFPTGVTCINSYFRTTKDPSL